jgi:hypothetical protein
MKHVKGGLARPCSANDVILVTGGLQCGNCLATSAPRAPRNCQIWVCDCGAMTPRFSPTVEWLRDTPAVLVVAHGEERRCKQPMRPASHVRARRLAEAEGAEAIVD